MTEGLIKLFTSKRVWVALFALLADILVLFGIELSPDLAQTLVTVITSLAGVIITAITGTDVVAGLSTPDGYDHKGRKIIDVEAVEKEPSK